MVTVSVVIPAYNAQEFIDRTLHSVRAQDYNDMEIIVVDDGSTDGTAEIIREHISRDDRIRLISTVNQGVARARNVGTGAATGAYIAYVDADDLWHERKISAQVAAMEAHRGDRTWAAAYVLHCLIDPDDRVITEGNLGAESGFILARHLVYKYIGNGSSLLVRKEVALEVGGFDPGYATIGLGGAEDLDFELKIFARWRVEVVREILVGYRIHPNSMSSDPVRIIRALQYTVEKHIDKNRWIPSQVKRIARTEGIIYGFTRLCLNRRYVSAFLEVWRFAWNDMGNIVPIIGSVRFILSRKASRAPSKFIGWFQKTEKQIKFLQMETKLPSKRSPYGWKGRRYEYIKSVDRSRERAIFELRSGVADSCGE